MSADVKAIISDFGGVLTTPLMPALLSLQDEIGLTREAFGEALHASQEKEGVNPLFALERGEITEAEFLRRIGDELEPILGHHPHLHRFREVFLGGLDPNPEMIDLMFELKGKGLRMAMLTNNVREWEPVWRPKLPVDEIFETVVDSGFVGCRKPEPEIYQLTLARLDLPAESCLFIDDLAPNIEGARALGLQAVHFQSNEQAIAEIRAAVS